MVLIERISRYIKDAYKSENKLFHIKRIMSGWYYTLFNMNKLRQNLLLAKYYSSKQYELNKWTFNQSKNYGGDFQKLLYSDNFTSDLNNLFRHLDEKEKGRLTFLIERMIFLSFCTKDNLFSEEEEEVLAKEVELINSVKKEDDYYTLMGYKFINKNMTIHNFIGDMGLKELPDSLFPMDKDIIDVGAYIGDSALILSQYTTRKVHAFEPFKDGFEELNTNILLNENKKIIPLNLGISDKNGKDKLYFGDNELSICTNNPDTSLSKGACVNEIEVENITIDSYVEKNGLDIGIIKIDAEGAEPKVLEGAKGTILIQKPILLVSIYHNINDFLYIKPWIDSLNLGYRYKITKPEATTFIEETLLVCYIEI